MKDQSFGVIPILKRDNEFQLLLVQHHAGHWAFPKGHAEPGESEAQAALRELQEETGIYDVTLRADLSITETYHFSRNGQPVEKTVRYFIGLVHHDKVKIQVEEIRSFRWVSYPDALALITYDESRRLLAEAHSLLRAL